MAQQDTTELQKTVNYLINKLSVSGKLLIFLLIAVILYLFYLLKTQKENSTVEYDTALIQEQIKNVSKLVVTEGHFAEVLTYKDKKETIIPGLTFDKKAIVVINADVTIGFDLSKIKYNIDAQNKTLTIISIPKEEIKISPDIKYYDTESSTFNEFTGEDHNKINKIAKENLRKKIDQSSLKTNAKNRLISELSNLLIVTKHLGWTLKYNDEVFNKNTEIQKLIN